MLGRKVLKYTRIYIEGYDMSCYSKDASDLSWNYNTEAQAALCDEVKNSLMGQPNISPGPINAFLDNTTNGLHDVLSGGSGIRTVMIAIGDLAAPAEGDPVFAGQFEQMSYKAASVGDNFVNASLVMGQWSGEADTLGYHKPWGTLLHENAAETGANSANSGLSSYSAAATAKGGFLVYQVLAGDGTATISVDDSANNSSWLALSGATSGEIDCSAVQHGLVALGNTATVRRYTRWQLSLNTATTVSFLLALIRPEL